MITFEMVTRKSAEQEAVERLLRAIRATQGTPNAVKIHCNGVSAHALQVQILGRLGYQKVKATTRTVGEKTLLAWVP